MKEIGNYIYTYIFFSPFQLLYTRTRTVCSSTGRGRHFAVCNVLHKMECDIALHKFSKFDALKMFKMQYFFFVKWISIMTGQQSPGVCDFDANVNK